MAKRIEMAEIQSLPDYLTNEAFLLVFASIPGSSDNRRLTLQCKSTPIPGETNEKVTNQVAGYVKNQSGLRKWSNSMSVTFAETKDMAVLTRLRNWMQYVRSTNTGISVGYSEDYSRTGDVIVFDSAGNKATACKIYKMFPTEVPDIQLDSSGSATAIDVSVTFSFDYVTHEETKTF